MGEGVCEHNKHDYIIYGWALSFQSKLYIYTLLWIEISLVWNSHRLASIQKYIFHFTAETINDFKAAISWNSENFTLISAPSVYNILKSDNKISWNEAHGVLRPGGWINR